MMGTRALSTSSAEHGRLIDASGNFDLRVLLLRVWSGRWWVASSIVLSMAAFGTAAFVMTPMYRAATVLVDASEQNGIGSLSSALGQLGGLASLAGVSLGSSGSKLEESLAVLRSREFTEAFIADHQLLPELFHKRWDANGGGWRGSPERWPTLAEAYELFNDEIRTISRDSRSGLITLQIVWRDPKTAASWANELVTRLNAEMRARAIASSSASLEYLEKELTQTSAIETRLAISRLMEAQINQRMLANVTQEYALRVVDRALPPDPRDVVRPKKLTLLLLGLVVGVLLGIIVALTRHAVAGWRKR